MTCNIQTPGQVLKVKTFFFLIYETKYAFDIRITEN